MTELFHSLSSCIVHRQVYCRGTEKALTATLVIWSLTPHLKLNDLLCAEA